MPGRDEPAQGRPRQGVLTRQELLIRGFGLGAAVSLGGLLGACGGGSDSGTGPSGTTASVTVGATTEAPTTTEAAATTAAAGEPKRGGRFRNATSGGGASDTLDPQAFVSGVDQYLSLNVFDRLTEVAPDQTVRLHLAESVESASSDATRWTVRLNSGITFQDGKPLTADDVIWSYSRIGLNPKATYFSAVDPFIDAKNLRKIDDLTVEIPLKQPYGDFQRFLAQRYMVIIPDGADTFASVSDVNGTGPFKVTEFSPGERFLLVRNDNYFLDPMPYLDEVEVLQIPDDSQINALRAGQIDGTGEGAITIAQAQSLEGNDAVQLFKNSGSFVPQFNMRLDKDPFTDVRVRQAFRMSIDRQQMLDISFLGQGFLGNDLHGPSFPSYNSDLAQREYDPEQAQALIKQAGFDRVEVELVTGFYQEAAAAWAEQAKPAGIDLKLKRIPTDQVYNTDLYYLKVPLGETAWGPDSFEFVAPQGFVVNAPYNETAWKRPDWDKRFFEATGILDEAARNQVFKELQADLWEEGGEIIYAFGDSPWAGAPNVHGVVPQVPGFIWNDVRFRELWMD